VGHQTQLLLSSRRPLFILVLYTAFWVLFELLFALHDIGMEAYTHLMMNEAAAGLGAIAAMCWAIMVWRDEGPRHREYHWSLPVDTSMHDAARAAGGLVWLVAGVTWYLILGMLLFAAHGVYAQASASFSVLGVVSLYCTALMGYLFALCFSTTLDHAGEWLLGVVMSTFFLVSSLVFRRLTYGFIVLFTGRLGFASTVYVGRPSEYTLLDRYVTPADWAASTLLWLSILSAVLTLSFYRNRRTFRI
jgi:hypothetical protein